MFKDTESFVFMDGAKLLKHKYLKKLMQIDNNYYEKLGTGKLIHIINSGTLTWAHLLRDLLAQGVNSIFTIVLSF